MRRSTLLVLPALLLTAACAWYLYDQFRVRHLSVTEQMSWECTDHAPDFPGPVVLLRFVQAPEFGTFQSDPTGSFCRLVSQSGAPTVTLLADVWGTKSRGAYGWHELQLNGRPYPINRAFSGTRLQGEAHHADPYAEAFDRAFHRNGR